MKLFIVIVKYQVLAVQSSTAEVAIMLVSAVISSSDIGTDVNSKIF